MDLIGKHVRYEFEEGSSGEYKWYEGIIKDYNSDTGEHSVYYPFDKSTVDHDLEAEEAQGRVEWPQASKPAPKRSRAASSPGGPARASDDTMPTASEAGPSSSNGRRPARAAAIKAVARAKQYCEADDLGSDEDDSDSGGRHAARKQRRAPARAPKRKARASSESDEDEYVGSDEDEDDGSDAEEYDDDDSDFGAPKRKA